MLEDAKKHGIFYTKRELCEGGGLINLLPRGDYLAHNQQNFLERPDVCEMEIKQTNC